MSKNVPISTKWCNHNTRGSGCPHSHSMFKYTVRSRNDRLSHNGDFLQQNFYRSARHRLNDLVVHIWTPQHKRSSFQDTECDAQFYSDRLLFRTYLPSLICWTLQRGYLSWKTMSSLLGSTPAGSHLHNSLSREFKSRPKIF